MKTLFHRLLTPLWLRPERALWDAHELYAVRRMLGTEFAHPALEYGCTEGVNTFILLGGEFAHTYDDYHDLLHSRGWDEGPKFEEGTELDYFRVFRPEVRATIKTPAQAKFDVGVSWRQAHLEKSKRLAIYDELHLLELNAAAPSLHGRKFRTIWSPNLFWSEPEHLSAMMLEHRSILHEEGRILTIVPDRAQREAELWSQFPFLPSSWRRAVDRNISANLTKNVRSDAEWRAFFQQCGLTATDHARFLPRPVGALYQVGLRPMFPVLMQMYSMLKSHSLQEFLDVKQHWIETVLHFMGPFADPSWQQRDEHPSLWHLYELRHAH